MIGRWGKGREGCANISLYNSKRKKNMINRRTISDEVLQAAEEKCESTSITTFKAEKEIGQLFSIERGQRGERERS